MDFERGPAGSCVQAAQRLENEILMLDCARPLCAVECSSSLFGRYGNRKVKIESLSPVFAKTSLKRSLMPAMPAKHTWGGADELCSYTGNGFVKSFAEYLACQRHGGVLVHACGKCARHPFCGQLIQVLIKAPTSTKSHARRLRRCCSFTRLATGIGRAMPCRPIWSLVAEDRSADGVCDRMEPEPDAHAVAKTRRIRPGRAVPVRWATR